MATYEYHNDQKQFVSKIDFDEKTGCVTSVTIVFDAPIPLAEFNLSQRIGNQPFPMMPFNRQ